MSFQPTLTDSPNTISSPGSESGLTRCALPGGLTIDPSGQEAAPARRSASRRKKSPALNVVAENLFLMLSAQGYSAARLAAMTGMRTDATSGRSFSGSSESAALSQFLANRLRDVTASLGATLYRQRWSLKVTPSGVSLLHHVVSVHRTSGSAFFGWPTPQAFDASNNGQPCPLRYKGSAPSEAGNTRTPNTPGSYRGDLKDYAGLAGWATPALRDFKSESATDKFNNYIDRDIDRKMERTKNRVLVKGLISPEASLVYATLLGIAGFMLLWFGANPLACWLGVMGFVVYVGVYSLYMKRHSVYGTLIGSLSGAAPPVIGYCAVTGDFDSGAAILLAIFSLWQMPHSYAIAIFRFKDYQAANIPVLPVVKGISVAKNHITLYIVAFAVATLMLSLGGYAGYKYLVVAAAVSVWWLGMALRGYKVADDKVWARKLFVFSIVAITALSVMMSVDFMVPDSHSLLAYVR